MAYQHLKRGGGGLTKGCACGNTWVSKLHSWVLCIHGNCFCWNAWTLGNHTLAPWEHTFEKSLTYFFGGFVECNKTKDYKLLAQNMWFYTQMM